MTNQDTIAPSSFHRALVAEATAYTQQYHHECNCGDALAQRLAIIHKEIEHTGTYQQTYDELVYGAKVAWRNTPQCIGKFYWQHGLVVRDMRHLTTADAVFEAVVQHLQLATNGGKIRLMLTVFAPQRSGQPGIRIWNPQLVGYAGYRQPDGSVVGDPLNTTFTTAVRTLGWRGGAGTPFDLLPLVIQMPEEEPKVYELPPGAVLEVPITHPNYEWMAEFGLRWYAHPAISNTRLEIGGLSYTAAPFSAWYTCTEIGARNLADVDRYNMLPHIAARMGLATRSDRSLWKDRALIELTVAVLHSYVTHGVSMIDHHYASRQFVRHEEREAQAGRITPGAWRTLIAPMSSASTPVFHRHYQDVILKPNFFPQPDPWLSGSAPTGCPMSAPQHANTHAEP